MEACRSATCKCFSNSGLGVKSLSNLVIAGSYQSWRASSLGQDSYSGKETDLKLRGRNLSVSCPTLNAVTSKRPGDGDRGKLESREGNNPDFS